MAVQQDTKQVEANSIESKSHFIITKYIIFSFIQEQLIKKDPEEVF
jgi:hypothetical protein